jgi:hypothetical protein
MSVHGTYAIREIRARDWHALGESLGLDGNAYIARIRQLAEAAPAALDRCLADDSLAALGSSLPMRFAAKLANHVAHCLHVLDGRAPLGRRR